MVPSLLWLMLESAAILYSKGKVALQADGAAKFPACCAQRDFPTMTNRQTTFPLRHILRAGSSVAVTVFFLMAMTGAPRAQEPPHSLELSRTVRPWEFLPVTGMRAGLLGDESGRMEAWVYPLKILREFHLKFHTEGRTLPAEALARTITVRPESSTILYSGDTFTVRETFFVPVREQGAVILLDVETEQPFEIEAAFHRDFQLEWPAGLGATYSNWVAEQRAFYFGEEQRKFAALVGSPTAAEPQQEYQTNYSEAQESSFRLGATAKAKERKLIVIAGSMEGRAAAEKTYRHLTADYADLLKESTEYYRNHLAQTITLDLPDAEIQRAYDWSRVSMLQGMVTNPFLGTGLVAGYRTSGESQRPGFAWFFGRDSFWTSLALHAAGDFSTAQAALAFISKYQRKDGKIPHEISQSASLVPWFTDYPYPYASADATPLYIIAVNDYAMRSGDTAFVKEQWDHLWMAYELLRSTYDEQGFPQNIGIGHGWVEGGPLLPVKTELYQTGLGIEALWALSNLAHLAGKEDVSKELAKNFEKQKPLMNEAFWIAEKKRFAFALDKDNQPVDEPSVLATVPMWFGLLDEAKADAMISELAGPDQQTDWGMRIISGHSPKFSGGGYHYGSVWPLFTGWASVGEYRYHRACAAYENLRANALLTFDGSLGHVTEVLSGDYYQPLSTSSPHQIWSAAMVISPILRGMFGLHADAANRTLTFAPHAPADWTAFSVRGVAVGPNTLDLSYKKTADAITLEIGRKGSADCTMDFAPAVSLKAEVLGAELNGRPVPFRVEANGTDQHVLVHFGVYGGPNTLRIRLRNDFGVSYTSELPALGSASEGLRILSETWTSPHNIVSLKLEGRVGRTYELSVWGGNQLTAAEGSELVKMADGSVKLRVSFIEGSSKAPQMKSVALDFRTKSGEQKPKKP